MPAFLIWGFWLVELGLGPRRGGGAGGLDEVRGAPARAAVALVSDGFGAGASPRSRLGFAGATVAAFSILLLEPEPLHAARVFCRAHVRLPARPRLAVLALGLGPVPRRGRPRSPRRPAACSRCSSSPARSLIAFVPRRKSILQLAALTAAILIGFELVLTHWFYLYIPWFFPFVAFALLPPERDARAAPVH